jgi:hypothetical protein
MPFFSSSSGVQINGGNFYDIAGDIHLQCAQPPGSGNEQLMPLPLPASVGRLLSGPERHQRHTGAAMILPYGEFHPGASSQGLTGSKIFLTVHKFWLVLRYTQFPGRNSIDHMNHPSPLPERPAIPRRDVPLRTSTTCILVLVRSMGVLNTFR